MEYNDGQGRALLMVAQGRAATGADPRVTMEHWDWEAPASVWNRVYGSLLPQGCQLCCVRVRCTSTEHDEPAPRWVTNELWWFSMEYPQGGEYGYVVVRAWGDEPSLELVAPPGRMDRDTVTATMTRRAAMDAQSLAAGACPCGGPCREHQQRTGNLHGEGFSNDYSLPTRRTVGSCA